MTETTELLVSGAKEKAGDLKISARCLPVLSCCPFYLPVLYKCTIAIVLILRAKFPYLVGLLMCMHNAAQILHERETFSHQLLQTQ